MVVRESEELRCDGHIGVSRVVSWLGKDKEKEEKLTIHMTRLYDLIHDTE